jgi:hypothetical protein
MCKLTNHRMLSVVEEQGALLPYGLWVTEIQSICYYIVPKKCLEITKHVHSED